MNVEMIKPLSEVARRGFAENWEQMLERRGLRGPIGGPTTMYAMVGSESGQATEADRAAIAEWLKGRLEVHHFDLSPLVDLRDER